VRARGRLGIIAVREHEHALDASLRGASYGRSELGLYTILPSPIVNVVWHANGGSVGERR